LAKSTILSNIGIVTISEVFVSIVVVPITILSIFMQSVVMLNVVMSIVVAPSNRPEFINGVRVIIFLRWGHIL
jgi:hypothetical protein